MSKEDTPPASRNTIGWLSKTSGVGIQTIRYYEREGLLPEPDRSESSNYRLYDSSAVGRMQFIRRAKELGFTLEEIRALIAFEQEEHAPCDEVRARAEHRLDDVRQRIQDLRRIEVALSDLVTACRERGRAIPCPVIDALTASG